MSIVGYLLSYLPTNIYNLFISAHIPLALYLQVVSREVDDDAHCPAELEVEEMGERDEGGLPADQDTECPIDDI
mgnify:CR=1 FL=1